MLVSNDARESALNHNRSTGRAPDYTTAFLITAGVVIFCVLMLLWALYGMLSALAVAWLLDLWIKRKPFHHNGIKPTQ